ncbi:MAG: HNH endonuclease [Bacteroidota bacterium]
MSKKFEGILVLIGIVAFIIYKIFEAIFNVLADNSVVIVSIILAVIVLFATYLAYVELYFRSKKFKSLRESISKHTSNCNDLNNYIEELKNSYVNIKSYNYGTGQMIDESRFNYQRKEWNKSTNNNQTHYCSASVCRNAESQPIKYLCKYFDIEKNEESLLKFEKILNDFTSVEEGKELIRKERESILGSISDKIPFLIQRYNREKLIKKLGFETVDISDAYIPTFTFHYISPGGNSSIRCDIKLDIRNLNKLIRFLNDVIKWKKSTAGQRALMTSKLREEIKKRDNYRCCECKLGIQDEPNLLLEIDHILPLSKGGMSTYENLQTLCWRCNRTKGAKIAS